AARRSTTHHTTLLDPPLPLHDDDAALAGSGERDVWNHLDRERRSGQIALGVRAHQLGFALRQQGAAVRHHLEHDAAIGALHDLERARDVTDGREQNVEHQTADRATGAVAQRLGDPTFDRADANEAAAARAAIVAARDREIAIDVADQRTSEVV